MNKEVKRSIRKMEELRERQAKDLKKKIKLGTNEKKEAAKEQVKSGVVTLGQAHLFSDEEMETWRQAWNKRQEEATASRALNNSLKHEIKRNSSVATMALAIGYTKEGGIVKEADMINIGKESALTRILHKEKKVLSSKKISGKRMMTDEIMSVSLSSDFRGLASSMDTKGIFDVEMNILRNGFLIAYNKKSGFFKVVEESHIPASNETILGYKFLGVTASGLRSGTLMYGLVSRDGKNCDRRRELINRLTGDFFDREFLVAMEKGDAKKLFKMLNRLSLGFADSKPVGKANYVMVCDKFVDNKVVICLDGKKITKDQTMDGRFFLSTSVVKQHSDLSKFSDFIIAQQVVQSRSENGGVKAAADIYKQKALSLLAEEFAKTCKVLYVIENGVRRKFEDVNKEEFFKKVEMVTDTNALKTDAYTSLEINLMKQAYVSESKLTMMVNMMMMSVDPVAFEKLITRLYNEEAFKKLRVIAEITGDGNGNISNISALKEGVKNNEAMFASALLKAEPKLAMALLPGLIRSVLGTAITSLKNMANELNPKIESKYMVVQSDLAAQFGAEILACRPGCIEIYSPQFTVGQEVSGVRNPISSETAVTTFVPVSLGVIAERIAKSNMTKEQKQVVLESFMKCKTYAIIPASNYLMEKHDGMDFDIDSMCFILDKEAVAILKKVEEKAVVIGKDSQRTTFTDDDKAVIAFQGKASLVFPENVQRKTIAKSLIKIGIVEEEETAITRDGFVTQFNLAYKHFANGCADIGQVATGNYNNILLIKELKRGGTVAELVAEKLRDKYECVGLETYKTPLTAWTVNEEGFKVLKIDKATCIEILKRYQNSDGSVMSTIKFLEDCCECNRYPGESAIDAAKNGYCICDYFNHTKIVMAMGSDKTVKVTEEDDRDDFEASCIAAGESLGKEVSKSNPFKIKTLVNNKNKKGQIVMPLGTEEEGLENVVYAAPDAYHELKTKLIQDTNTLVVIASKMAERAVESDNSEEIRLNFYNKMAKFNPLEMSKAISNCRSINTLVTTKEALIKSSLVIDEESVAIANREHLLPRVANTVALAFNGMTKTDIGMTFIQAMLAKTDTSDQNYGFINQKCFEVFKPYVIAFLESEMGADLACYEKITICEKGLSLNDVVGQEAVAAHGFLETELGLVELDNHKLDDITGIVTEDKMFKFRRPVIELKPEEGIFMHSAPDNKFFGARTYKNGDVETATEIINRVEKFINDVSIVTADRNSKKEDVAYYIGRTKVGNNWKNNYSFLTKGTALITRDNRFKLSGAMDSINSNVLKALGKNATINVDAVTTNDVNIHLIGSVNSAKIQTTIRDIQMNNTNDAVEQTVEREIASSNSIFDMEITGELAPPAPVTSEEIPTVQADNNGICW